MSRIRFGRGGSAAILALVLSACGPDGYARVEARVADFPSWLRAGPMLGHATDKEVRVWYQLAPQASAVEVVGALDGKPLAESAHRELGDGCHIAIFRGLRAGGSFSCELRHGRDSRAAALRLPDAPSSSGKLVLAFGSCCRDSEFGRAPIFARIADRKPDLMLFAGDNSYFVRGGEGPTRFSTTTKDGDWDSHENMLRRHLQTRRLPALQNLLASTPCYAIWDDHDYGPNDAAADFVHKEAAAKAFHQVWANPDLPDEVGGGIATRFRRGPVEVWLLDNRWFKRTRDKKRKLLSDATIWGAKQFEWLKKTLRASDAPIKLLVNGTQIFEEGFVGEGHWQEAKRERAAFESFVRQSRIDGLIVLSGDRHHHEAMRVGPVDGAYIYEFTSSPFQDGQRVGPIPKERSNKTRLFGTRGNGFGLLTIDVRTDGTGKLRFEIIAEDGKSPSDQGKPCTLEVPLSELRYKR